jgi:pseudouridine kinase
VRIVSTTGAGDALLGGLVCSHLQFVPLEQAVSFAMACAELTLSSPFANAPGLCIEAVHAQLEQQKT